MTAKTANVPMRGPDGITQLVHREDEWKIIEDQIETRRHVPTQPSSVLAIYGTAGIGKSTFLFRTVLPRIKEHYPNIPVTHIDFDSDETHDRYKGLKGPGQVVIDLAHMLEKETGIDLKELPLAEKSWHRAIKVSEKHPSYLTDEEKPHALVSAEKRLVEMFIQYVASIVRTRSRRPVILVLDTAEDASWELMGWIQEYLQGPTTEIGFALWIVASRRLLECQPYFMRPRYRWIRIKGFSEEQVATQIASFSYLAPKIYRLSFGLPAAAKALAETMTEIDQDLETREDRHITSDDLDKNEVRTKLILSIDELLNYQRYLGQPEDDIREALKVLSPLRYFVVGTISELLPELLPEYFKNRAVGSGALTVIQRMVQTNIVAWDRISRGYSMEYPLRRLIALTLDYMDHAIFARVHEMAFLLYTRWAKLPVEEKRKDFIIESLYHQTSLLSFQGEKSPGIVLAETLQSLIQSPYISNEQEPDLSALNELYEQLRSDEELRELLSASDWTTVLNVLAPYVASQVSN